MMSASLLTGLVLRDAHGRGAIPPPPGVIPNFEHPVSRKKDVVISAIVCPIIAGLFFALRLYTRIHITRTLGWDDCKLRWVALGLYSLTGRRHLRGRCCMFSEHDKAKASASNELTRRKRCSASRSRWLKFNVSFDRGLRPVLVGALN